MRKATKVLYLSNFSDVDKGGQISLFNLVKRLHRDQYEPLVLCPEPGPLATLFREEDIPVKFFSFPHVRVGTLAIILWRMWKFRRLASETRAEIIHTDSPRDTLFTALAVFGTGRRVVWHARVSVRDPVYDHLIKHLVSRIICVSWGVRKRFEPCSSTKCVVIHNGVDITKFSPDNKQGDFRADLGIPEHCLIVSTIMQIIPQKGAEEYVRAAATLCQERDDVYFVVVGRWADETFFNKLQDLASPNHDRIIFPGYRKDIWSVLRGSDLFVLPSWPKWEGLPRVAIEAMSSGVPVIGTDVEGTNEVIVHGETGLLTPPRRVPELVNSIESFLDDRELRLQSGINARERAVQLFDINTHVQKVEALYRQIV